MTNLSFHLFQLQKIDLRLDQINSRIFQIQESVKNDQALKDLAQKRKALEIDSENLSKEIAELSEMVRAKRVKIELSESSLYKGSIQNPKELGDIQKEIASLKNALTNLENQQFQKLLASEKLEEDIEVQSKLYVLLNEGWLEANQKLLEEQEVLEKEKEKLVVEHDAVIGQVSSENISLYEKLRISKNRIAVTSVEDESCSICGSEISAANIQKAKSSTLLTTCPSCGRILYTG
jgi:predicted  nucleic acid-binding Zn-ribbon protein